VTRPNRAETKSTTHTAGHSLLDHRRNEDILEEREVVPVEKKLIEYKQK
jgi:hypothetical protein